MTDVYKPPVKCPECGSMAAVEHAVENYDGEAVFLRSVGICVPCGVLWRIGSQKLRIIHSEPVEV